MPTAEIKGRVGRRQGEARRGARKTRKLRLAEYPRVSSRGGREDDKFRSPDFQRTLIRSRLAGEFELVPYPAEIDVSGGEPRREVLDGIIADIEAGRLDGVAVAKLDRLSRLAPRYRVELLERIEGAGGIIKSASESLDVSTPEGRFARNLFLELAFLQLEQLSENFEIAKRKAIEEGIAIKGSMPFGIGADERRHLTAVDGEADVVLELFERRAGGASYGELAELFHARTGRNVHRSTIRYMLGNRVYLGEHRYNGELSEKGRFDAIVPLELFEAVQRVNRDRSSGRGRTNNRARALLAGIARCANCGGS